MNKHEKVNELFDVTVLTQGLVRNWTELNDTCIQHWCEEGKEQTKDLRKTCTCPPVSC